MKTYTAHELSQLIDDNENIDKINVWLARGDGVAVYQNVQLDSSGLGHTQFLSYGSPAAQFETDEPPTQMPDFPGQINWRYQLQGTYRGDALEPLVERDWITPFVFAERVTRNFTDPGMAFADRVSSWGVEVRTVVNGSGQPTQGRRVDVTIKLLNPFVAVSVQTWQYPEGVNALGPFDWHISTSSTDEVSTRHGSDPNLGAANVTVYNTCLSLEDA